MSSKRILDPAVPVRVAVHQFRFVLKGVVDHNDFARQRSKN